MTLKFKEDTCQMNRTYCFPLDLAQVAPAKVKHFFFFPVALESSKNLNVKSLYHSTVYIKIS